MKRVLLYFSGFLFGLSLSNIKERNYYNAIIKELNSSNQTKINILNSSNQTKINILNSSNQKYKNYIIHKNLLEDWHTYDAYGTINNVELPSKQID